MIKTMVLDRPAVIDALAKILPASLAGRFTVLRSEPDYLEFINPAASKEAGLQSLLGELGLQPANLMAIGNGLNDRGMVNLAACGVTVANAENSLKSVSDFITRSDHNHDAVAEAINQLVFNHP